MRKNSEIEKSKSRARKPKNRRKPRIPKLYVVNRIKNFFKTLLGLSDNNITGGEPQPPEPPGGEPQPPGPPIPPPPPQPPKDDIDKLLNTLLEVANNGGEYVMEFRESYHVIEGILKDAKRKYPGNEQQIFDILANWSVDWYDELVRLIQAYASDSEYNTSTGDGTGSEGRQKYLEKCRSLAKALGVTFVEARVTFI